MNGSEFSIGDRVELLTDFCGFISGMIGYVAEQPAQGDGCINVCFYNRRINCCFEFPATLFRKVNPSGNEVFINEDIDTYNLQLECIRKESDQ